MVSYSLIMTPQPASVEVGAAFARPIDRVKITSGYRIRLSGVLLGLAALQLLYLLLIAAVVALTIAYSISALGAGVSLNFLTIVFYLGPPAVGIITTLFLLKPILIRPAKPPEPIRLLPEEEPELFDFVDRLCRALGSPKPSRIYVDLQVNASAAIHGWRGFFLGDLTLTIGLPLAAGLTLPQFTGVLAHEFGHFAQRAGLRSYFLIQTMQHWFNRVVNQRDKWDALLAEQCGRRDWRIKAVAHLASQVVKLSRRYLALLMKAGSWISSSFSRQMEFDADRYEAAVVGAEVFEQTSHRMQLLMAGAGLGWQDASKEWSLGRLPEDVAALISFRANFLPPDVSDRIIQEALAQGTGLRDTHPCMAERIESIRRGAASGILKLDDSAEHLFRNLPELCRRATRHHYDAVVKIPANGARLIPASETILNALANREFENAGTQLFGAPPEFCSRWFQLPSREPRETGLTPETLSPAPATEFKTAPFASAFEMNLLHFAALTIKQAGVAVKAESFRLNASDLDSIRREERLSTNNLAELVAHYNNKAKGLADRIEVATARLLKGELGLALRADRRAPVPDLAAAWSSYTALSEFRSAILEIRRWLNAARIVRINARFLGAAACANLLDELEHDAISKMDEIIGRTHEIPASVIFNECAFHSRRATGRSRPRAHAAPGSVSGSRGCNRGSRAQPPVLVYGECLPASQVAGRCPGVK
jgi:Zn-dependent protease with chaperone function